MTISDSERREKKNKCNRDCYAFAGEEPSASIKSKERDEDEIVAIGDSCEREHEREDVPELWEEVSLVGEEGQHARPQKRSKDDERYSGSRKEEKYSLVESSHFYPMFLADIFSEARKHGKHEKGRKETEDLGHVEGNIKCRKFFVRQCQIAEIVRQETEVETVYDIDDTERKSHFEDVPCKMRIDLPDQVDFLSDEIETQKQCDCTSQYKGQENQDDALCILE